MKKLKIFPKTFMYTFGIMLFILVMAHLLIYLLVPHIAVELAPVDGIENGDIILSGSVDPADSVTRAMQYALPVSLTSCILISAICSYLFSRSVTIPIKQMQRATEQMAKMGKNAACMVTSHDELEELSDNINQLYRHLIAMIENLELEKQKVSEIERSKIDFLRMASHELKTPVTALSATLENMILGIGRYKDYDTYLPECKEMVEQLSAMIQQILETSRMNGILKSEQAVETDLTALITELCEPYQLIAAAHGILFNLDMPEKYYIKVSDHEFCKAVSNIVANAVTYTKSGNKVSIYMEETHLIIENECTPINTEELLRIFEPFYRPDFSRSRDNGGNGLGLYIVANIFSALEISYAFVPMNSPQGMRFIIDL